MPLGARPTPGMERGVMMHPETVVASQVDPLITERLEGPSPPLLFTTKTLLAAPSTATPKGYGPTVTLAGVCPQPLSSTPSHVAPSITETVSPPWPDSNSSPVFAT